MQKKEYDPLKISAGNDIDVFIKLYLELYTDDTAIIADSSVKLQKGLDILHEYCEKWKVTVNVTKTKITIFEKRKT